MNLLLWGYFLTEEAWNNASNYNAQVFATGVEKHDSSIKSKEYSQYGWLIGTVDDLLSSTSYDALTFV